MLSKANWFETYFVDIAIRIMRQIIATTETQIIQQHIWEGFKDIL